MVSLLITTALIGSTVTNTYASPGAGASEKGGEQKFKISERKGVVYSFRGKKDVQAFVKGKLSDKLSPSGESALTYINLNRQALGITDTDNFKIEDVQKDELGYTNVKLVQMADGIKVKDRILNVHFNSEGVVTAINGNYEKGISFTKAKNTTIDAKKAENIARQQFEVTTLKEDPKVENLVIIKDGTAKEVYKVNIKFAAPNIGNWDVFVDSVTGEIVDKIDNIRYDGPVTGTGIAVDGTTKTLNLYQSGSNYQMIDATKAMTGRISTYNTNNTQNQPGTLISKTTNVFNSTSEKAAVSAHYFAGVVYDFYKNLFSRNSLDNNGMSIISTVHYGRNYNNAFWDGTQMVYGDGDGSEFTYLSGDLDVVGHEMTHGVDEHTANLNYQNQSGALNESISDVFGVLIQTYDRYGVKNGNSWAFNDADWVVGDDVYTPGTPGDALRSLANPKLYDQPDNMSGYVNTTSDNGGVHTNSGITNKAAYLIAKSIGCEKTARVYYRALTTYLTSTSDFTAMRNAAIQAGTDLYGGSSAEVTAIKDAFTSVGIGSSDSGTDTYEPNDSISTAYSISFGNTYNSLISSSTDLDYYKVTTTKAGTISVTLGNLPADFDLYLKNSSGSIVARSEKAGTSSESITYSAKNTGTYYIEVFGYNGAYSTSQKYALKVTFQ